MKIPPANNLGSSKHRTSTKDIRGLTHALETIEMQMRDRRA